MILENSSFKFFLFNDLLLLVTPFTEAYETRFKYNKHFFLTKDTVVDDKEKPPSLLIIFPREKIILKFENEELCNSFKKCFEELCVNLSLIKDKSNTEDALKSSIISGSLMYKKFLESAFVEIYIKLKGDTLFFYENEKTLSPNFFVNLKKISILFAENKVNTENVIEFSKQEDPNFVSFFLHTPKQKILKTWLDNLSKTSASIDPKVKEYYMQEIPNTIFFKISCR